MEDFNWVEKRCACSVADVFIALIKEVEIDTATRHAQSAGLQVGFRFQSYGNRKFVVYRSSMDHSTEVEFVCKDKGIHAKGNKLNLVATVGINDQGECRLRIGEEELENWQFRKRVLEALFFDF